MEAKEVYMVFAKLREGNTYVKKDIMIFETKRTALDWAKKFYMLKKPIWRTPKGRSNCLFHKVGMEDMIVIERKEVVKPLEEKKMVDEENLEVKESLTRSDILDAAKERVCGHREQDYGSPEDNFSLIANLWTVYLNKDISSLDVAMMMGLLKIARIKNGGGTGDSFVDLAGYAACGGEIFGNHKF